MTLQNSNTNTVANIRYLRAMRTYKIGNIAWFIVTNLIPYRSIEITERMTDDGRNPAMLCRKSSFFISGFLK